ncbi:MAG TPA: septation protein SepH [Mycobacterium sp.]|nr:septation protein SepH [Mycobacterium sp.]
MRELKVVGLDVDGKRIICETAERGEKFILRPDDRLRAALSGERAAAMPTQVDVEVPNVLTPKEIQARIRAGASVEQVAGSAGVEVTRVERFAHPVLLERSRAAELATAAHPVLVDGPAVLTLLETVTTALVARGLDPDATSWDAWRNEDGRWTVQLSWKAGRSDNVAHFRFVPGAHGGTATAFDDAAAELIDPEFDRPPLRSVAPVPTLDLSLPEVAPEPPAPAPEAAKAQAAAPKPRTRKRKPKVPGWEDVLLGVRSGAQP